MTLNLNINPDPAIAWEKIYQDYIHECQMLLVEVPKLGEKLVIYLIQQDQHCFPYRSFRIWDKKLLDQQQYRYFEFFDSIVRIKIGN
jgi:hypothetical protein